LSNQVNAGAVCLSTGGGNTDSNANGSCSTAFNLAVKKPGDSGTTDITLKNVGSLAASALKGFSGSCTDADAAGENYHGTGSPCGLVQIYIQQYSDAFTTPSACLYGGASGSTCDFPTLRRPLDLRRLPHQPGRRPVGRLPAASGGADTTWSGSASSSVDGRHSYRPVGDDGPQLAHHPVSRM